MKLKFDFAAMTDKVIGSRGISAEEIAADEGRIVAAAQAVLQNKGKGMQQWSDLPFDNQSVSEIEEFAAVVRRKADAFVVFGIGGSALGLRSVAHALLHLNHNQLESSRRAYAPRIYIEDNVDPERMSALFEILDLKKTYFNFITKSGETCETLSQFLVVYDMLKKTLGKKKAREHIIVTTTQGKGSLFDVADKEGFKVFDIPAGVGGRFSVLSAVGLLPLSVVGVNIKMLLRGAAEMDAACSSTDVFKNPALMAAYLHYKSMQSGKNISVMMPYADSLKYMADFYAQLWGESLGKAKDENGNLVYAGQTPVKAVGVTDQHSQIQLYTEGPFDKIVTFLAVEEFRDGVVIPDDTDISDFAYLKGHTFSKLMDAERRGTAFALCKAQRSNYTIFVPLVCEYTVGELITYFMYQTAFAARLMGVNAFDQPGVEAGKIATYAMLGRNGYADTLEDLEKFRSIDFKIVGDSAHAVGEVLDSRGGSGDCHNNDECDCKQD